MYFSEHQVQNIEQRSIALYKPSEGPQSLPVYVDRKCFQKTQAERANLQNAQQHFKNSGLLKEWNERNRPGNNKKAA